MNREKYQQVKQIFQTAIELEPNERIAFLDDVCRDKSLRRDVDILLDSFESQFLEKPVIGKIEETFSENKLTAGRKINQYEIREKLGAGGMGEVYLAQDTRLNRLVAIKFLLPVANPDAKAEKRLLREAQSVAALDHPNICTVYEVGEFEGRSFIVMQYVEGETLDARIKRKPLTINESLTVAANVADALTEAHSRGIIHRDIKPSNIIISSRGQIKVLDFSLAKKIVFQGEDATESALSQAGVIAGTVAYMSPEQARGQEIDERSDIWSLGVVLYEMLTGRLPFVGETKSDTIAAILQNEPALISSYLENLPDGIEQILKLALEKKRDERYQRAEDFARELRRLQRNFVSEIQGEIKSNSGKIAPLPFSKHQTESAPKPFSNEVSEITKLTDSEKNPVTDKSELRLSVEYLAANFTKRKFIILAALILIISVAAIWQYVRWYKTESFAFSDDTRANLQISTLFNAKLKPGGRVSRPVFSHNGNLLAFSLSGEGKSTIYIKQINGGEPVKITDGKWFDENPLWSMDGQRVVFVSDRNGQRGIWAVSYLGGNPVLLLATDIPAGIELKNWSQDGRKIYYERTGSLYTLDITNGQTTEIISNPNFSNISVSPDETLIAYVAIEGEKEQIWVQSRRDQNARQITQGDNHHWSPTWFPDSRRLAYSSDQNGNYQIYVVSAEGGEPTQITFGESDAENPIVSPDGLKISFKVSKEEANLHSFNLAEKKETAQTANVGLQLSPDISPDGRQISFEAMSEQAKIFAGQLKIKSLDKNSEPLTITNKGGAAKWSPDGKSLAFVRRIGSNLRLWHVKVNGMNERLLTENEIAVNGFVPTPFDLIGTFFSWSPNGSDIAYSSRKSGFYNLWTVSADSSNERMWTQNADENLTIFSPLWSPKGNRIAYLATANPKKSGEKPQRRLCIAELGQTKTVFQAESQIRILSWSASSEEIFFAVKEEADIFLYKVSADSNEKPKKLANLSGAYLHGIRISPDDKRAVFTARRGEIDNIYLISIANGETRQLTSNLDSTLYYSGLTWSPDGKTLYYSKQTGGMQILMISNSKFKGE